mgnify:FL=1
MKIENENYITIQGWMRTKLDLSGNELIAYALIYGFSQDGESVFSGSSQYISEWLGIDKKSALRLLKRLSEEGIVTKKEEFINGVKFCRYVANPNVTSGDETSPGVVTKHHRGGDETSPNNNIYNTSNINIEKENICISSVPSDNTYTREKQTNKRFVKPTVEEVDDYVRANGYQVDAESFVSFYESKGWRVGKEPMKDWKASVRYWNSTRKRQNPPTTLTNKPTHDMNPNYRENDTWDVEEMFK